MVSVYLRIFETHELEEAVEGVEKSA